MNFYRDALLLEDFAMVNYTAVIKLLKKQDKAKGTAHQRLFMAEVMSEQPFTMYVTRAHTCTYNTHTHTHTATCFPVLSCLSRKHLIGRMVGRHYDGKAELLSEYDHCLPNDLDGVIYIYIHIFLLQFICVERWAFYYVKSLSALQR